MPLVDVSARKLVSSRPWVDNRFYDAEGHQNLSTYVFMSDRKIFMSLFKFGAFSYIKNNLKKALWKISFLDKR